jgi:AI-2 transport protein TqsA
MALSRMAHAFFILIAVVVILSYTKLVLMPLVLALVVWYLIRLLQVRLKRIRINGKELPLWLRGVLAFGTIVLVLGLVSSLMVNSLRGITEVLPHYQQNVLLIKDQLEELSGVDLQGNLDNMIRSIDLGSVVSLMLNSLTTLLSNGTLILIYVAFLMLEERHARFKLMSLYADDQKRSRAIHMLRSVDASLSHYVTLKTAMSLLTGGLSYVALLIIGVDFAFFWALVIFLLNYIPTVGSLIATFFPALIAALQFASYVPALWVLGVVGAIQMIVGNVLEPRIMGNSLNVSSLVVILALTLWGSLWGIVGMILSVPITVTMVIVMAQFSSTRWVAVLLSDRGKVGEAVEEA